MTDLLKHEQQQVSVAEGEAAVGLEG